MPRVERIFSAIFQAVCVGETGVGVEPVARAVQEDVLEDGLLALGAMILEPFEFARGVKGQEVSADGAR